MGRRDNQYADGLLGWRMRGTGITRRVASASAASTAVGTPTATRASAGSFRALIHAAPRRTTLPDGTRIAAAAAVTLPRVSEVGELPASSRLSVGIACFAIVL